MSRMGVLMVAVVGLVIPDVQAMVLCTSRAGSGTVRVRATCKASETQLDPIRTRAAGAEAPEATWRSLPGGYTCQYLRD